MDKVLIKKVEDSDIPNLIKVARSTFEHTYRHLNDPSHFEAYMESAFSDEQILKEVADPNSLFYILVSSDEIVGYLKLNRKEAQTEADMDNALEIERIYVVDHMKGYGLGARLVQKSIEVAREESFDMLWLGVWERNPAAQGFYKKQGFEPFGEHVFMMGPDPQRDILMKMEL